VKLGLNPKTRQNMKKEMKKDKSMSLPKVGARLESNGSMNYDSIQNKMDSKDISKLKSEKYKDCRYE
jgi:hypothetical protein